MGRRKEATCLECDDAPFMGHLCKTHYDIYRKKEIRRDVANEALNTGAVNGKVLSDPKYRKELEKLRRWRDLACDVINSRTGTREMPLDEAESALSWCITLCQEIIDADHAKQHGIPVDYNYTSTHEWVWERFENLKAGRMSNGLSRPKATEKPRR